MVPAEFLPPPWYFKCWTSILSFVGKYTGHGYWFWNLESDQLFWNATENEIFGYPATNTITNYSRFSDSLWDDDDRDHVRKTLEIAKEHRSLFRHQFCIKNATTGEKTIIDAKGRWLFHEDGTPWALWGWNKKLNLASDQFEKKEAAIKLRQKVEKWKEYGLPEELSYILNNYASNR